MFNPEKTGIEKVVAIFWTIDVPPGLKGLSFVSQGAKSNTYIYIKNWPSSSLMRFEK